MKGTAMTIEKIRVILSSAVTWLTFALLVLSSVAAEVPALGPIGETASRLALQAVVWVTVAISIIRRVSPVPPNKRGIL